MSTITSLLERVALQFVSLCSIVSQLLIRWSTLAWRISSASSRPVQQQISFMIRYKSTSLLIVFFKAGNRPGGSDNDCCRIACSRYITGRHSNKPNFEVSDPGYMNNTGLEENITD